MKQKLSVYVHYPYCSIICNYCNFNKYKIPENPQHESMEKFIVEDLEYDLKELGNQNEYEIQSIYFGGGTPSLARPTFISAILKSLDRYKLSSGLEITLEGNPKQMTIEKLKDFRSAGVNRISLGIQALNDDTLIFFGRDHRVKDAKESIKNTMSIFNNVSLDFIWGRPKQDLKAWEMELNSIIEFNPSHLSLYQLTLERGTPLFGEVETKKVVLPSNDIAADMYEMTRDICESRGFKQYEVSSFAKEECNQSRHNTGYWKGIDYIGVGPGAHGRILLPNGNRSRLFRTRSPKQWMQNIQDTGSGIQKSIILSNLDMKQELVVFGLRTTSGLSLVDFNKVFPGENIESVLDMNSLEELERLHLIEIECSNFKLLNIRTTKKGLLLCDSITTKILKQ